MNPSNPPASASAQPEISAAPARPMPPVIPRSGPAKKGFFKPEAVRAGSFFLISLCIVVSVIACILAIWEFTGRDGLWRMVASCLVVAVGTALFAFVNSRFGEP